jgi:RNA polymerase sigma-70 factor (ECF subfamily)
MVGMADLRPPATEIPDELIVAAQADDPAARHELYLRIRPFVARVLATLVGRGSELRELRDEIALEVMLHLPQFRHEGKFTTWMYSVVVFQAKMWRKRRKLARSLRAGMWVLPQPESAVQPDAVLERREDVAAVAAEILRLPKRLYLCLLMVDLLGISPTEVADVIGSSPRAVSNYSYRAKMRLRDRLAGAGVAEHGPADGPGAERRSEAPETATSPSTDGPLAEAGARHGGRA